MITNVYDSMKNQGIKENIYEGKNEKKDQLNE
jgi:hypothetical protein